MARDERLSQEEAARLELEILEERKRLFKQALLELMKENPEQIYSCTLEVIKRLRKDNDREIRRRTERLREFTVLVVLAIVAATWYWTRH